MASYLWLSWKDSGHPGAGGAEVVMHEIIRRQVAAGHQVTILTARYGSAPRSDQVDGAQVIRLGRNRYLHSFIALAYYLLRLRNRFDTLIEVVNTAPYFAALFPGRARPVLFYHQLAREIWWHEAPWPLNWLGYHVLEAGATRLLSAAIRQDAPILSVSDSTSRDLRHFGFRPGNIKRISEGITLKPLEDIQAVHKYEQPTLLSFGALRAMKQTLDQIAAFESAKRRIPELKLMVAGGGSGAYASRVKQAMHDSLYSADIEYLGRVSEAQKRELMERCHLLLVTSLKEGWGLVVSEANSQGTPAVVYDADGLRDSVKHSHTGLVTAPTPKALAKGVVALLTDQQGYQRVRHQAHDFSLGLTFDQAYADFQAALHSPK